MGFLLPILLFTEWWWAVLLAIIGGVCFLPIKAGTTPFVSMLIYFTQSILFLAIWYVMSFVGWIMILLVIFVIKLITIIGRSANSLADDITDGSTTTPDSFYHGMDWLTSAGVVYMILCFGLYMYIMYRRFITIVNAAREHHW